MRKTILLVIMTTAIIFSACTGRQAKEKEKALDTIPMMVMQIQKCSRLYTAEAQVHRIITHDDQLRLKGSILKTSLTSVCLEESARLPSLWTPPSRHISTSKASTKRT